jgi:hypothetical protein
LQQDMIGVSDYLIDLHEELLEVESFEKATGGIAQRGLRKQPSERVADLVREAADFDRRY